MDEFVLLYCFSVSSLYALSISFFNRNYATVTLTAVESYNTINESEESVILTHTYVFTRIVNCTTLTNDNVTCNASLTTPNLNA